MAIPLITLPGRGNNTQKATSHEKCLASQNCCLALLTVHRFHSCDKNQKRHCFDKTLLVSNSVELALVDAKRAIVLLPNVLLESKRAAMSAKKHEKTQSLT